MAKRKGSRQTPKQGGRFSAELITQLSQLPFEQQIDSVLNALEDSIAKSGIIERIEAARGRLPYIPATIIPTPFGTVEIPPIEIPELSLPKIDDRRREALKAAIAIDISGLVAVIPIVGDVLADIIEDTYGNKIREVLTPKEAAAYSKYDRVGPSTVAMLRALGGV